MLRRDAETADPCLRCCVGVRAAEFRVRLARPGRRRERGLAAVSSETIAVLETRLK